MEFELLFNKSKIKKKVNDPDHYNTRLKKIIELVESLDNNSTNLDTDITNTFKDFINLYTILKKKLSVEIQKHQLIHTIVDDLVKKAINNTDNVDKTTNTTTAEKKIDINILNKNTKKTIKLNVSK